MWNADPHDLDGDYFDKSSLIALLSRSFKYMRSFVVADDELMRFVDMRTILGLMNSLHYVVV